MAEILSDKGFDLIFRAARSHNAWLDEPVSDTLLNALYDLMKMGPTSVNCSPARVLFLKSEQAKEKIKPHLAKGNVNKVMTAPVCAIIGYDTAFYEKIPQLFPHNPDAKNGIGRASADITYVTSRRAPEVACTGLSSSIDRRWPRPSIIATGT